MTRVARAWFKRPQVRDRSNAVVEVGRNIMFVVCRRGKLSLIKVQIMENAFTFPRRTRQNTNATHTGLRQIQFLSGVEMSMDNRVKYYVVQQKVFILISPVWCQRY